MTTTKRAAALIAATALLGACSKNSKEQQPAPAPTPAPSPAPATDPPKSTVKVQSSAFAPGGEIPKKHTCQGDDVSPPLSWSGAPAGTKAFALIVSDPDAPDPKAPKMTWVHWVLYDLPATTTSLPEATSELPAGTREGKNDWKRTGYGGPCPPIGRHRYFHQVYALDAPLGDLGEPTKAELEKAMTGHVLARGELVGTYEKTGE